MDLEKLTLPLDVGDVAFKAGIGSAIAIVGALVAAMGIAIKSTFDWADEMDRLGDVTGMTNDKLAAWAFVAKKAGVPVDTLSRSMVILEKGLVKADGTLDITGKQLKDFGVNVLDANGKVKDQSDLMNDIATKYASFSTQQERVNFLTGVFGRSGAELVDVFDTLAKEGGIDAVTAKVEALGLVLDPSQYENFRRNLNEIKLTFTGLANAFTGPLLPGAEKILDIFKNWLQSPWVANEIKNIGDSLGTLLSDLATGLTTGNWQPFTVDEQAVLAQADYAIAVFVQGLDRSVINWINEGGPKKLTRQIVGWLSGIPDDEFTKSQIQIAADGLFNDLNIAIGQIGWGAIGKSILDSMNSAGTAPWQRLGHDWGEAFRNKFMEGINAILMDWHDFMEKTFSNINWWGLNLKVNAKLAMRDFAEGISEGLSNAYDIAVEWLNRIIALWNSLPGPLDIPTIPLINSERRVSGGSAGGLTWVGERGPELVNLPNGSFVNNASDSAAMQQIDYDQMGKSVARHLVPALQVAGIG